VSVIDIERPHRLESRLNYVISKYGVSHGFKIEEWIEKLKRTKGHCVECNENYGIVNLTMDHILPLSLASKGFVYKIEDVRPVCISCNAKANRNRILLDILDKYGLEIGRTDEPPYRLMKINDDAYDLLNELRTTEESFGDTIKRIIEERK